MTLKLLLASGLSMVAFIADGSAMDIKVLSPVALKPVLAKVAPEFERSTGNKLVISWGESGSIKADVEKGVPFDIAVMTPNFADDLVKQGKLDGETKTPVARSGIGVAIRRGAPKPDVSTTEAFKRTLLDAKAIGVVEHSASSRYFDELVKRLGIADAVKDKIKLLGGPAVDYVSKGEPELAISQIGAIVPFESIELAGPLPAELQRYTVFVATTPLNSAPAVRAFLKLLVSPAVTSTLKESGLEPPM